MSNASCCGGLSSLDSSNIDAWITAAAAADSPPVKDPVKDRRCSREPPYDGLREVALPSTATGGGVVSSCIGGGRVLLLPFL